MSDMGMEKANSKERVNKKAAQLGGKHAIVMINEIELSGRARQNYGDLNELALSLREKGQLQNIVLIKIASPSEGDDGHMKYYKLLAGGRRLMAMRKNLEWQTCSALIFDRDLTERERLEIELDENRVRQDFNWQEDVELKHRIHMLAVAEHGEKRGTSPNAPGVSIRDTAKLIGQSATQVSKDISLAKALEMRPDLFVGIKTKDEANKLIDSARETHKRQQLSMKASEIISAGSENRLKDLISRYITGDFFTCVKDVPDDSIDFIEIDPPYAIDLKIVKKFKDASSIEANGISNYNEVSAADYPKFMLDVLTEAKRVMRSSSWGICWHAPISWQPPISWQGVIYNLLLQLNLHPSFVIGHWIKPIGQSHRPESNLANACEDFLIFKKGNSTLSKHGRSNVFQFSPVSGMKKSHPTEKPIDLMQEILSIFSWEGSRILIPFLGSGKTILAAESLNMTAFGYELSPEYRENFVLRASEMYMTGRLQKKEEVEAKGEK